MNLLSRIRSLAAVSAGALLLAACGGGGGGDSPPSYGKSSEFAEGVAGCSVETQKRFVRAYLDENYLWYRDIPSVDAASYTTIASIDDYFNALTNLPQDRFSEAIFSGKPASMLAAAPAAQLGLDGLLAAHAVPAAPTYVTRSGRKVAYVALRNHLQGAQDELIAAFQQMQAQSPRVDDLVLDLRNNTGGFVYVALTAASMITGPQSNGQVFERLVFNDKRGEISFQFGDRVQYADSANTPNTVGTQLPQLGLTRVFVLTGGNYQTGEITCSASESIINSLRGIGVQVIRIGETTCGKPYGFSEKVNCGYSYFPIEFQGFNAAGFGDYAGGFEPMCRISSNVALASRGNAGTDPVYNAALQYVDTNSCPAGTTATGIQSSSTPIVSGARQPTVGARRLLLPEQQPR